MEVSVVAIITAAWALVCHDGPFAVDPVLLAEHDRLAAVCAILVEGGRKGYQRGRVVVVVTTGTRGAALVEVSDLR